MRKMQLILWAFVALALGAVLFLLYERGGAGQSGTPALVSSPKPADHITTGVGNGPVRAFDLRAHTGQRLTNTDLDGRYRLMYFGYTSCPDKCPLDLAKMTLALGLLEKDGVALDLIQPLFVTIDPERDDEAAMADTVSLYHPKIVGLTGTADEIASVAKTFGIYYRKIEDTDLEGYLMDHLVAIFLYDREGRYLKIFTPDQSARVIASSLKKILRAADTSQGKMSPAPKIKEGNGR